MIYLKSLSAETLFHFVSKKEYLFDILSKNFRPRYVEEKIPFEEEYLNTIGIPMLCFCDIRLSEVHEHVDWYGHYGIGMRSTWGIKNSLTPIQYYNKNSQVIKDFGKSLKLMRKSFEISHYNSIEVRNVPAWYFDLYLNVWHMKEFRGKQVHRKSGVEKNKKFYDEREWRYIPSRKALKELPLGVPMSIAKSDLARYRNDKEYNINVNNRLGEVGVLKFEPEDIAYIIIQFENERFEFLKHIRQINHGFSEDEIVILSSKILSLEQIKIDF